MGSAIKKVARVVAPFSGAAEGLGLLEQSQGRKAARGAAAQASIRSAEAKRLAEEKEELRKRIFSGIRTGGPQGITEGESVGRTRLLGG